MSTQKNQKTVIFDDYPVLPINDDLCMKILGVLVCLHDSPGMQEIPNISRGLFAMVAESITPPGGHVSVTYRDMVTAMKSLARRRGREIFPIKDLIEDGFYVLPIT